MPASVVPSGEHWIAEPTGSESQKPGSSRSRARRLLLTRMACPCGRPWQWTHCRSGEVGERSASPSNFMSIVRRFFFHRSSLYDNRSTLNSAFYSTFTDRAVEVGKTCAPCLADVGSDLANPPN